MGILSWIVFGALAGFVAKLLMPGKDPGGFVVTVVLGIVGAMIGGFVGQTLGIGDVSGFDLTSFGLAVLGTLVLLVGYRIVKS